MCQFFKYIVVTMFMVMCMFFTIAFLTITFLTIEASCTPENGFTSSGLSIREVALNDPIGAYYALEIMHETQIITNTLKYADRERFRHTYFSARLTQEIGPVRCEKFTNAYERFIPSNKKARDYDLQNNEIGRNIGIKYKLKDKIYLKDFILNRKLHE